MWNIRTARLHTWRGVWEVAHFSPGESISRNWAYKIDITSHGRKQIRFEVYYPSFAHISSDVCVLSSHGRSFDIANRLWSWQPRHRCSILWREKIFFISSKAARPTLQPTQRPVQWVPGESSPLLKQQGRPAACSPSSTVVNSVALRPFLIGQWSLYFPEIFISISSI